MFGYAQEQISRVACFVKLFQLFGNISHSSREHSLTLKGELSLFGWPPVWLVRILLLCFTNSVQCLPKSKYVDVVDNALGRNERWQLLAIYIGTKNLILSILRQGDQIWRYLAILGQNFRSLVLRAYLLLEPSLTFFVLLGKLSLLKRAKYWIDNLAIWS